MLHTFELHNGHSSFVRLEHIGPYSTRILYHPFLRKHHVVVDAERWEETTEGNSDTEETVINYLSPSPLYLNVPLYLHHFSPRVYYY